MKLELKHLVPYLPHEVKAYFWFDGELMSIYLTLYNAMNFVDLSTAAKLALLPLSALTEPMEGQERTTWMDYLWFEIIGTDSDCFDKSEFETICKYSTDFIPMKVTEYLFANHFDIYGLIDSGLAIDKRTVK